jgi:hypothetical protein
LHLLRHRWRRNEGCDNRQYARRHNCPCSLLAEWPPHLTARRSYLQETDKHVMLPCDIMGRVGMKPC